VGLDPHSPNTPSWRGAQVKHGNSLPVIIEVRTSCILCVIKFHRDVSDQCAYRKRDEVTGRLTNVHSEKLGNLYSTKCY
jgi:hypothetical protein